MMRAGPLSTRRLARLGRDFVELALGLGSSRACPLASTPRPVLLLWMTILFAGFSLMAPPNTITLASLIVCALSVSAAIFLVLGLDQPFSGLMAIERKSLMNALPPLGA